MRYLLILILFCGCTNNLKIEMANLREKSIIIPNNLIEVNNDSTDVSDKKLIKMIIYYDSTECSSCAINRLFLWKSIINNYCHKLQFYFLFQPRLEDEKFVRAATQSYPNYPIFIDKNGDFEKLNPHLPKNKALHTFLLDENNKVILVGNQLNNKEIEKLFYQKTQELLSK